MTAVDLPLLHQELTAAGVLVPALGTSDHQLEHVHTYDAAGYPAPLPVAADPVLAAHRAPPLVTEFAGSTDVSAIVRTTDAAPLEVFRFACAVRHLYHASLTISGIDATSGAAKLMEGRFVWKRLAGAAIISGLTVVSDIHDAAAASWLPNYAASGTDVVFTVQGAAGRTIDWLLQGQVGAYAPDGI